MPLVNLTRATLRSAEFGFLGVVVYTRVHTPRRCGLPLSAAVLVLATLSWRPLRTSCWIVGMDRLSLRLLLHGGCPWLCCVPPGPAVTRGRACRPSSTARAGQRHMEQPRHPNGVWEVSVPVCVVVFTVDRHTERPDISQARLAKIPGHFPPGKTGVADA